MINTWFYEFPDNGKCLFKVAILYLIKIFLWRHVHCFQSNNKTLDVLQS